MALYKRGKIWWISYSVNGRRVQKPMGTKKETARATLENIRYNIRAGRYAETELTPIPFEDLADKFLVWAKMKKSYDSIKASASPSREYFKGRMAHTITEHEVETFRAGRKETPTRTKTPRTNSTCNHELAALKQIFNKGIAWGLLERNPAAKVKPLPESKGRTRFLSIEEAGKLLDAASRHLRPILICALETGMRRGEILSLRWSDVDMKTGMLYIGKTKNGEPRHIPMSNRLRATLAALPRRLRTDHVFTGSIHTRPAAGKRKRPLNQPIGKIGEPFNDVRT
jgi:integrase